MCHYIGWDGGGGCTGLTVYWVLSENVWVSSVSVLLNNVSYENRCGVTKEKKETSTWSVGKNP